MREYFRAAAHKVLSAAFGTDVYGDVSEKLILQDHDSGRRLLLALRSRIEPEIRQKDVLFIHVPKNGGTSISNALYGRSFGHRTIRYYRTLDPELVKRIDSFAIVREPLDRFLSSFSFVINGGGDTVRLEPPIVRATSGIKTIDDYLDFIEGRQQDVFRLDNVMRPQTWYLFGEPKGPVLVKRLFLLNTHESELLNYLQKFGITKLPFLNRAPRSDIELSPRQKQRVERIYPADFELYERLLRGGPLGGDNRA